MSCKAIIFDFDGVILDSANIKTEAFPEVFNDFPHLKKDIVRYHLANQGISRYKKFEWIYENLLNEKLLDEKSRLLGDKFSMLVFEKILKANFIAGAPKLLEFLLERKIPAFIASGTPEEELKKIVIQRQISAYFSEIHGSPHSKSDIIRSICTRHNYTPAELLFIGDATTDFYAAEETGTGFIAVDSPELHDFWFEKKVKIVQDLTSVMELL